MTLKTAHVYYCLVALILWGGNCALWAQTGRVWCSETTQSAQLLHSDTLSCDTILAPMQQVLLTPRGDIRLRRFFAKKIVFAQNINPSVFELTLTHQMGQPFKQIGLQCEIDTVLQDQSAFQYKGYLGALAQPILHIRPYPSLRRQIAHLSAAYTQPVPPAYQYHVRQIWVRHNAQNQRDTIWQHWLYLPNNTKVLVQENAVLAKSQTQFERQHRFLSVRTRYAKPALLLPNGKRYLPRLKPLTLRYNTFKAGDTLVFAVKSLGKKPIKTAALVDNNGVSRHFLWHSNTLSDTVIVGTERYLELRLRGYPQWIRQAVQIEVQRVAPAQSDTICQQNDTLWARTNVPIYDTLALLIRDDSLTLFPLRQIENNPYGQFELNVSRVLSDSIELLFVAYWFGVNRPVIQHYQNIEATIPKLWALPGVPPALCAFALKYPVLLPRVSVSDIAVQFNQTGRIGPTALLEVSPTHNLGIIASETLEKAFEKNGTIPPVYHFFLCFSNQNTVNAYPVQVKMIAFYRKKIGEKHLLNMLETKSTKSP